MRSPPRHVVTPSERLWGVDRRSVPWTGEPAWPVGAAQRTGMTQRTGMAQPAGTGERGPGRIPGRPPPFLFFSFSYCIFLWDFYFRALGSLVVLSFLQLLSFSSVLSKPLSETLTSAGTAGCPMGQQL
jgi:hypothetical protein